MNETEITTFLNKMIDHHPWHQKWLNTLSLMENCGARNIMKYQSPQHATLNVLKHAAEEARHAYFFKAQIAKLPSETESYSTYNYKEIWGGSLTKNYVNKLNVFICRLLKSQFFLKGAPLRYTSYLLTTFVIEIRAMNLYPLYQKRLKEKDSPINLQNVLSEEERHLEEMSKEIKVNFPHPHELMLMVEFEKSLFESWQKKITREMEASEY